MKCNVLVQRGTLYPGTFCRKIMFLVIKADTSKQFLGFVVMYSKVCSLRLDLQGIHNNDFVDPSLKEINIVDQYDISNIFHCDGLLLCVRWIQPRSKYHKFHRLDMYAFGYDKQQQEP